jgi:predicted nucleotidyltransferase
MRPSEALALHIDEVRAIIARYPVANPRLFGSVARGEDREGSDIDILVDDVKGLTYFDIARLQNELSDCLGQRVDLGIARSLEPVVRDNADQDIRPL